MTTITDNPATPKQISFLNTLMSDRVATNHNGDTDPQGRSVRDVLVEAGQDVDALTASMTKATASAAITRLMGYPKVSTVRPARPVAADVACPEGIHRDADGAIVKVYTTQAGNLATRTLRIADNDDGTYAGTFEYTGQGPIRSGRVSAATILGHAEAAAFGALYGFCCACGRDLDTEESLAAGYGPKCARRYGWPWGRKVTHTVAAPAEAPAAPAADETPEVVAETPAVDRAAIIAAVMQSVAIHPDWDLASHVSYVVNDALLAPSGDTPVPGYVALTVEDVVDLTLGLYRAS